MTPSNNHLLDFCIEMGMTGIAGIATATVTGIYSMEFAQHEHLRK